MKYTKTDPCSLCPFRNDDKRLTVAVSTLQGFMIGEFACHKTAELVEDDNGQGGFVGGAESQHCAGALIFLEHIEQPHQMMRICERLGMYDRTKLNMDAPVFTSWEEIEETTEEFERMFE